MITKASRIEEIMERIATNHMIISPTYRIVRDSLKKLTKTELSNLYIMILCSTPSKLFGRKEEDEGLPF